MTKGLHRSLSRGKGTKQSVQKGIIPVKDLAISIAGTTGVGYGSAVIGELPQGNILVLGAVAYLQFFSASANVTATYDGDYAIGTTPTADATVTGTDADIIPLTALGAATAKLSPVVRGASTGAGAMFDNTDDSLELNLNLLIDDAATSGTAPMTANGHVIISYIVLGDD
jgi:hypothetical protein